MHVRVAGSWFFEVGENAQDRRLAAARRPEQRDEGAGRSVQVDVVEGGDGGPADRELLGELPQYDPPALLGQDVPFRLGFSV
jgi:hypothetical protein